MAEGFESMAEDIEEEPPNGKGRFSSMISNIKRGLKQELKETRDIPGHISRGDFVSAARQVADIIRMIVLAVVWILPGGMQRDGAMLPVEFSRNLKVMSIGFLLPEPDTAVVWRGPLKM